MKLRPFRFSTFVVNLGLTLLACLTMTTNRSQAQVVTEHQPQNFLRMQQIDAHKTPAPAAKASDVASLDAILIAVYDAISGPKGKARDWDRFRSLFAPGARLIPTDKRPTGETASRALTVEEFIASSGKFMEEQGFFERGIANHVETFAHIAHVFSVYEGRHDLKDPKPFVRGINSIQLMNDGTRWWVVTIFWQAEDPANPIPKHYLKTGKR